jgi:uncharacterized protein (TIGR02246 family)
MPIALERPEGARRWISPLLIFAGTVSGLAAVSRATDPQDEKKAEVATSTAPSEVAIRNLLKAMTAAYNQADAKGLTAVFTDDAVLFDPEGEEVRGRNAIGQHYGEAFDSGPTCKIVEEVEEVHFLSPDVASVIGRFHLDDEKGTALFSGRYSLIAVQKQNQWKLAELRDLANTNRDTADRGGRLRQLEWLVGDWIDEGENGKGASTVRWEEGQKFLVRKYSIRVAGERGRSGTQLIGWDPQARQIRSWVFGSEGDFGHGGWTRSDNAWIIKSSGVTGEGLTTSSTEVIEPINKDSLKLRSTDRVVGTELLPDIEETVMVRKPPSPNSGQSASTAERKSITGASAPKRDRP